MTDPNKVTYEQPVLQQKTPGKNILHAPQPALPAGDEDAFASATVSGTAVLTQATNVTILNNMRSRIDALETALTKLGLIKPS